MGSNKGQSSQNQNTSQASTYNPAGAGYVQNALNRAGTAANNPFAIPQAPVAGFSQDQQGAFQQFRDAQGAAQPYYNQANNYFSPQGTQDFYNPYAANVMANMQDVFGAQNTQNTANLTQAAGGVGADRIAVGQANLAKQQGLAAGQTMADLWGRAGAQAQSAGQGQMALGNSVQNSQLQGTNALLQSGGLQQQLSQAQMNSPYQQQLAMAAFPYQQAQFLAGITGSLAPGMGGTTSGYGSQSGTATPAQPSIWSQLLGAGMAGVGAYKGFGEGANPFGSYDSYGGGNAWNSAYGGSASNPLPGLDASDYAARGGVINNPYAAGGEVEDAIPFSHPIDISKQLIIPQAQLAPIQANIPQIDLRPTPPPQQQSQQGSGGGMGDMVSAAAKLLPLLLAQRGGRINPYATGGRAYADGGAPDDDTIYRMPDQPAGVNPYQTWRSNTPMQPDPGPATVGDGGPRMSYADAGAPDAPAVKAIRTAAAGVPAQTRVDVADTAGESAAPLGGQGVSPYSQGPAAAPQRERGFADSPWAALMQAGLGIMGGTSPYAGVNIGTGAQQGFKTLQQQRENAQKDETVSLAARRLALEAKHHEDLYTRTTKAQQLADQRAQLPYEQLTLAEKNAQDIAKRKQELDEMKPVQVGTDDRGMPIMMKRNPETKQYELIQPKKDEAPVGPTSSVDDPGALPPNSQPVQGVLPNGLFGTIAPAENVNPEALDGLTPAEAKMVRAIAEGRQKFLPQSGRGNVRNQFLMGKVHDYDANVDEGAYSRRAKTQGNFASGVEGRNVTAMNTFGQHAMELYALAKKLNLGNYTDWNAFKSDMIRRGYWGTKELQDTIGEWEVASKAVADEGAKVFAGTNSALADRAAWEGKFDLSNPGHVTAAKLKEVVKLVEGRLDSLQGQYNNGMRTQHKADDFIVPKTRKYFEAIKAGKDVKRQQFDKGPGISFDGGKTWEPE